MGERYAFDRQRDSGIELLKIVAILFIVISHTVQTLTSGNPALPAYSYVFDATTATTDIRTIELVVIGYSGIWGNSTFFICSAWFFLKGAHFKPRKWLFMVMEIWTVSVIILALAYPFLYEVITWKDVVKCFFPTTFANNWYMTCYLLFYLAFPYLNWLIAQMDQRRLFRVTAWLTVLYIGFNFIKGGLFFPSMLILWMSVYFLVAYMQRYMKNFIDDRKKNAVLLLVGMAGWIGMILMTEALGLHFSFFSRKIFYWESYCNPFIIVFSLAMFNLARNIHFQNKLVNYISGLTLLIYIIHENLLLRNYVRPEIWKYIHDAYGYSHVVLWTLVLGICIFIFGLVAAMAYKVAFGSLVRRNSNFLYEKLALSYSSVEAKLLK